MKKTLRDPKGAEQELLVIVLNLHWKFGYLHYFFLKYLHWQSDMIYPVRGAISSWRVFGGAQYPQTQGSTSQGATSNGSLLLQTQDDLLCDVWFKGWKTNRLSVVAMRDMRRNWCKRLRQYYDSSNLSSGAMMWHRFDRCMATNSKMELMELSPKWLKHLFEWHHTFLPYHGLDDMFFFFFFFGRVGFRFA